jgi:replicative DNA helicase
MAKRLDVAVVLLAQLSRGVEGRDDKRPVMSDLRDSGNIEEHADFVGLLYRPAYYLERSLAYRNQEPEAVERAQAQQFDLDLVIGKNRLGPTNIVSLWCNPSLSSVDNKARY